MTHDIEEPALDQRAWWPNWLLATVWLVFMAFPLLSLWWATDISDTRKIVATTLAALFATVYATAFHQFARNEVLGLDPQASGIRTLWILIAVNAAAFAIGGWGMLGMVPYVAAYAVLHLSWRWAIVVVAASHVAVIIVPILAGVYGDLWPITPAVATASMATMLGRFAEERSAERTMWRTELLLRDDRNRVARDVHDVLGHSLTTVVLKAELTQRLLDRLDPTDEHDRELVGRCRTELDHLLTLSRESLSEIRSTVGGLRRPDLPDELALARSTLTDRGVGCTVVGDAASVAVDTQSTLAWVVREATTNIVRHADADQCSITLAPSAAVLLRIDDDGVGPGECRPGNGLTGLRERVADIGATLSVTPLAPTGTRLEVRRG